MAEELPLRLIPSESLAEDALYSAVEILEQRAAVGEAQFAQVVMEEGMPFPTMLLQYSSLRGGNGETESDV